MGGRRWKEEDENLLCEFYETHGASLCAEVLERTVSSIHCRAQILGLKSKYFELKTTENYVQELISKNIPYRPLEDYKGCFTPIKHSCPLGHEWSSSTPSNILRFEAGCTKCSKTGFNPDKPAKLYYVRIINSGKTYYKIGITNRANWKRRFSSDTNCDISVLHLEEFTNGEEARRKEKNILREYSSDITSDTVLLSGNTEIFDRDVLALDKGV